MVRLDTKERINLYFFMHKLETIQLKGNEKERRDLQLVLESAPDYSLKSSGNLPSANEAQNLFTALPPDKTYAEKFVQGIFLNKEMIGCADVIRGHPTNTTAMIGLLILSEKFHGIGLGKEAYSLIENLCLSWPEINTARIGVLETNSKVLPFWKKLGFVETGRRVPYSEGTIKCETIVLEKKIKT